MAQTVNRDTALATAAVYQEMFGEPDGTIPATYQVSDSYMLYLHYLYYLIFLLFPKNSFQKTINSEFCKHGAAGDLHGRLESRCFATAAKA